MEKQDKEKTNNSGNKTEKRRPWNEIKLSAEELFDLCEEYLKQAEELGVRATKPLCAAFCGISNSTWERWRKNEDGRHKKHADVIKRAEQIMGGRIQQENNTVAIFLMKQQCYGGLSDNQDNNSNNKLTIEILSNGQKITG